MVLDKIISKMVSNEKNQFNKVCVDNGVIDSVVFYSKKSYPNEFLAMFDGHIKNKTLYITSLIFLPGERSHTSATFNDWLLPPDQKKVGSVHSHPGFNTAYPSGADLVTFSKYGNFHIIVCEPYSLETMRAYDAYGQPTTFEVGDYQDENHDLIMEDLEMIKAELEMENGDEEDDVFTKLNKAFCGDDDFFDDLDSDLEKENKYSHEFKKKSDDLD